MDPTNGCLGFFFCLFMARPIVALKSQEYKEILFWVWSFGFGVACCLCITIPSPPSKGSKPDSICMVTLPIPPPLLHLSHLTPYPPTPTRGDYYVNNVTLDSTHSGKLGSPVVFKAHNDEHVRIHGGGYQLGTSPWTRLSDDQQVCLRPSA